MLEYEQQAWDNQFTNVAGIDEAGRGPLAGPVVAACVLFDKTFLAGELPVPFQGLTDSKQLTAARRDSFFDLLTQSPWVHFALGLVEAEGIDRVNILRATHKAMRQAAIGIHPAPDHLLVDGRPVPDLPCPSTAIVKGDAKSLSIAAASIIAKVTRDRLMLEMDAQYPQYGFARHKGYGTSEHLAALKAHGPCPFHRRSFQPVRDADPTILKMVQGELL
ncbi:MAG: ribonuclease HII [Spartobacteria bacterium]|nr:ribonuclease HII [Spartobacteria bacterium]